MDHPNFHEEYHVNDGTIRFNRDLPDERFKPGWTGDRAETPRFRELRVESDAFQPESRPATDPESLRKQIDERLAEADRQSARLEASSPARETWNSTTVMQVGFLAAGAVLILVVFLLKRRVG